MPLVKQTGSIGPRRNLNILCDVFLSRILIISVLLIVSGCCAKVETHIKLLNDEYIVGTPTNTDKPSPLTSGHSKQQSASSHYNIHQNDLQRISYETIHRILRDENEPMTYRTSELRYFQKRSSVPKHKILKRSLDNLRGDGSAINLTSNNLLSFNPGIINITHNLNEATTIFLHNNSLKEFPLASVPNIISLDLSKNNFSHFEVPSQNSHLRVLNMNQNHIVDLKIFPASNNTTHSNLHELHLKDNRIHNLGQLNLSVFDDLEILDLSCNQLENLETAFFPSRMKNLKYLNLAQNRLQCIYRETFYNLLSMNTLILSYNEITDIDYETFLALPNLQYLDLSHNRLSGDSIRALQGIPDLVGLSIAYNKDLGDSMQEFVASWSLKELDARGTGLCKIPAALAQSVRTLNLADNWLTIISCGDLDSYPLLQYLDLSNSHIDEIEEDALGRLEILETLFLDHNNLKRIPLSLPTGLEHLFMHDNQIMDIQPQTFQGLNNLKTLDLSTNKLIYLPVLPLPKLITLNLQSSGINGLHQGIVKSSPHLRDLFLEDNPIKCSDLLGISEWASPCRNDRHATNLINLKSHFVRMHNYFERFQCGGDAFSCSDCAVELQQSLESNKAINKPNCLNVNWLEVDSYPTKDADKDEKQSNYATNELSSHTSEMPLAHKTYTELSGSITQNTTDSNQDEAKQARNALKGYQTTLDTPPEISTPTATTKSSSSSGISNSNINRIHTNSSNNIIPQQKQLAKANRNPFPLFIPTQQLPLIKSDNNYVEANTGKGNDFSTYPPSSSSSLSSQENTGESHKGLKTQSDNTMKIGHGINGEISVPTTATKSNLPKVTAKQRHSSQSHPPSGVHEVETKEKQANVEFWHHQQQHNKIHEILHTKDRHLIGTPLLIHKGHVVLVPPLFHTMPHFSTYTPAITTTTASTTLPTTTIITSKENLLLLASSQDSQGNPAIVGGSSITESNGHKMDIVSDANHHNYNSLLQQQQTHENAVIKLDKKKMGDEPSNHEIHYQHIQQYQQQYKTHLVPTKKVLPQERPHTLNGPIKHNNTTDLQKKTNEMVNPHDINKHFNINNPQERNSDEVGDKLNLLSQNLNTPQDGRIPPQPIEDLPQQDDGGVIASTGTPGHFLTASHHSRVNTPLLKTDLELQSPFENMAKSSPLTTNADLLKHEDQSRLSQTSVHPQPKSTSQRWLDIRKATHHPGLVVVIAVTFGLALVVGLAQVYRQRQNPLNYAGHVHCRYEQTHHYQHQDHEGFQDHQRQHTNQHQHCHCPQPSLFHRQAITDSRNNHNPVPNCICDDDRVQTTSSPNHLLHTHEKPPLPPPTSFSDKPSCSTHNYRLFHLNSRQIKHNHCPSLDDDHDFYTEMNHGPQSGPASDFFPMELLSVPSRTSQPSSSSITSINTVAPTTVPHNRTSTSLSLVANLHDEQHQQQNQREYQQQDYCTRSNDGFQDIARERNKFELW